MPVFSLPEDLVFPHPVLHEPEGLLAVGGSLSAERLLLAYRWGIFPWYNDEQPILWWWTAPRLMLKPEKVHISHSVRNVLNQNRFSITMDKSFREVMIQCSSFPRKDQDGTWILPEMIDAYTRLFNLGHAHSLEVYEDDELVGGLYGVAIGKIFSGESMFAKKPNASKVGFIHLCRHLHSQGFEWIDCQQDTPHMRSMGGELIAENEFLEILRRNHIYMLSNGEKDLNT